MQICIAKNYPKNLVQALKLIYQLQLHEQVSIFWDKVLFEEDASSTVVLVFDTGKRRLNPATEEYFNKGYKVFAFKRTSQEALDLFELSITVLSLWSDILKKIRNETAPFIFTYNSRSKKLTKVK